MPREWLQELASARNILSPPQTRVNDQGFAEDVPPESADAEIASAESEDAPAVIEPATAAPTPASFEPARMPIADTTAAVSPAGATRVPVADTAVAVDPAGATRMPVADTAVVVDPAGPDHEYRSPMPRKSA